jgi:hypothetical protein
MGYTHYIKSAGVDADVWAKFLEDAKKLVKNSGIPVQYESDEEQPPMLTSEQIRFNGVGEAGHETFLLERKGGNEFCKTAQKPYDTVVTAILVAAKHHFPNGIRVTSDGGDEDWADGFELAEKLLGYTASFDEEGCLMVGD